ncbi:MAG: LemA protein [Bacteroidia bacterium]|jgi:LemA protein
MIPILAIIAAIVILPVLIGIGIYNGLIRKRNFVENAFSSIDVMLKKRRDLIPNLVEAVKAFMTHEKDLLTKIVSLREGLTDSNLSQEDSFNMENQLSANLGKLSVQIENYPDLKSNTNVLQMQQALNEVEEQISASRRSYNAAVNSLNNGIETFPSNVVSGWMNLQRKASFEIPDTDRANVNVGNLFKS